MISDGFRIILFLFNNEITTLGYSYLKAQINTYTFSKGILPQETHCYQ